MSPPPQLSASYCAFRLADILPPGLLPLLRHIYLAAPTPLYLVGGTVRDLLLARQPGDIDITLARDGQKWAHAMARLSGGTYVELGHHEDTARVVWRGTALDFSSFRQGAQTIEEDLAKRDVTINSLALPLHQHLLSGADHQFNIPHDLIDPLGGLTDIRQQRLRVNSQQSFRDDPLRMLRIFRLHAILNFAIERTTLSLIAQQKQLICQTSPERITQELMLIMASAAAHDTFSAMRSSGLLWEIIPELQAGVGLQQPASHHLDVFEHNLECLYFMEQIQRHPSRYFPGLASSLQEYLRHPQHHLELKWAALLHDLGKPPTHNINREKEGRITFYNHEAVGAQLVHELGKRMRWSNETIAAITELIAAHMRPFHLCNVQRHGKLSLKACLRLIKLMGVRLPALFMLAMADTLAGRGEARPATMEEELLHLFQRLVQVYHDNVLPVHSRPPLVTGNDLIEIFQLRPGPIFSKILRMISEAQMTKEITTRHQALELVRQHLQDVPGERGQDKDQ